MTDILAVENFVLQDDSIGRKKIAFAVSKKLKRKIN